MKKFASYLVGVGLSLGVTVLPNYKITDLIHLHFPAKYAVDFCYDMDKDGKADITERRGWNPVTQQVSEPLQIWVDVNKDGKYSMDELYTPNEPVKPSKIEEL